MVSRLGDTVINWINRDRTKDEVLDPIAIEPTPVATSPVPALSTLSNHHLPSLCPLSKEEEQIFIPDVDRWYRYCIPVALPPY